MTEARAFEAAFASALVAADPAARPPGLDGPASRRFTVYRNNVHVALRDALAQAYPAVARLVGPEFFAGMARAYHDAQPVRPPSLALHGAGFADFIEQFAPAAAVPYLGAVARLERAWLESFHAEDAGPLDPAALPADAAGLDALHVRTHPAARLVSTPYPMVSLWQANTVTDPAEAPAADIVLRGETALIVRPRLAVQVLLLDGAEASFTARLLAGASVADARARAGLGGDDAGLALKALAAAGAFQSIASP